MSHHTSSFHTPQDFLGWPLQYSLPILRETPDGRTIYIRREVRLNPHTNRPMTCDFPMPQLKEPAGNDNLERRWRQ